MPEPQPFIHDLYAPLSHIPALGTAIGTLDRSGVPTWVADADARRLTAYRVLASMRDNARRYWYPPEMWTDHLAGQPNVERMRVADKPAGSKAREYGDSDLITLTGRALVLGEDQTITFPDLQELDDEDAADQKEAARVQVFADWLNDWAETERLPAKLMLGESDSVGSGDGVYVLSWDANRARPRLKTYDPGFYFPDLDALDDPAYADLNGLPWSEDYPPVVHLAWEREDRQGNTWLRRTTFRMVRLDAPVATNWNGSEGRTALRSWTCVSEISEWLIQNIPADRDVYTLDPERHRGVRLVKPTDLELDFIPVVHIPNTEADASVHFGKSILLGVAQVLDDVMGSNTDLAVTSETVGSPPMILTGAGSAPLDVGPGTQLNMPTGGGAALMDTSKALTAGMEYAGHLERKLAVNARLGLALLGQISPKDVPSGYALALGFAPARRLTLEMRAVRAWKHPLILKFAMRMAQAYRVLPAGTTPRAVIDLGAALPSDLATAVQAVKDLLPVHGISRSTSVRMLQQAGLPIEDAQAEVERIAAEAFEDAVRLVDATGDVDAAFDLLGLDRQQRTTTNPEPTDPANPADPNAPVQPPVPGSATGGNT